jgi:hypothetical protein
VWDMNLPAFGIQLRSTGCIIAAPQQRNER